MKPTGAKSEKAMPSRKELETPEVREAIEKASYADTFLWKESIARIEAFRSCFGQDAFDDRVTRFKSLLRQLHSHCNDRKQTKDCLWRDNGEWSLVCVFPTCVGNVVCSLQDAG